MTRALHGRRLERREAVNHHVFPHNGIGELTVAPTRTPPRARLSTENDPGSERHIGGDLNLRLNHRADVLKVDPVPCVLLDHTLLQNPPGQCRQRSLMPWTSKSRHFLHGTVPHWPPAPRRR